MSEPVTTIPPFNDRAKLPACAAACGPLYDANGACVPPELASTLPASVYTQCFCSDTRVHGFATATTNVCDDACTAEAGGLSSIAKWYRSICNIQENKDSSTSTDSSASTATDGSSSGSSGSKSGGGGGDWVSNHWQWVIFLVVMVVAIIGIWVGACIWRRRYLRKKDGAKYALGQNHSGSANRPSWGPGMEAPASNGGPNPTAYDPAAYEPKPNGPGQFMPGVAPASAEKVNVNPNQRWVVNERT